MQAGQLGEMGCREFGEAALTLRSEAHPNDPVVVGIGGAPHQPGALGTIDELDCAVMLEQQVCGDVPDRRIAAVPADRQQQLVLGGRQAGGPGLFLRPPHEPAQPVPESQQIGELVLR